MLNRYSRRNFLLDAATAAASAALALPQAFAQISSHHRVPIGIQLNMVGAELRADMDGTLAALAAIGYRAVEPALFTIRDPQRLKLAINNANLQCPSAHLLFGMVDTEKLLDDACALGVHYAISTTLLPHIRSVSAVGEFIHQLNTLSRDDFKQIAELANSIGEKARQRGLQYAYHNHNFEFRDLGNGETGYAILLQNTDPQLVKFEADVAWMALSGVDPLSILGAHPECFPLLHFRDFSTLQPPNFELSPERNQLLVELGQGKVAFKPIVEFAQLHGVEHYIVDQEPPYRNKTALEAAKIDFDYLSALLNR